jgi:hypothetical protein
MADRNPTRRPSGDEDREAFVIDDVEVDRRRAGLVFARDLERTTRRPSWEPRRDAGSHGAPQVKKAEDVARPPGGAELSRLGRRGRLRPEVVALVLGVAFLLAALVKPWPNPARTSASESAVPLAEASGTYSAATASAASLVSAASPAATQTVDIYLLIPPYDYRPGQWPPPTPATTAATPADTPWSHVDWSFLTELDGHVRWGVSALSLPSEAPVGRQPVPVVSWAPEVAPWSPSVIAIPQGSSVFALALTWPSGLKIGSVSIDYLGAADSGPTVDMPVAAPIGRLTPLPGLAVATPPRPAAQSTDAASGAPVGGDGGLISGTFWLPPSSDLASRTPGPVRSAWQSQPWPWPLGMYRATLASNAGTMIVVVELQPA